MQRRWQLPKGVLREHLAIKKRRFPPRPCSGIDSAVTGPWQHADVNEEKGDHHYVHVVMLEHVLDLLGYGLVGLAEEPTPVRRLAHCR